MNGGTFVARVRRVVRGHSERTLVHAVTEDGLESKLEVSSDAVADVVPGQELALTLTWTLQPVATSTATSTSATPTSPPAMPTPLPSAVDEEFMALMARRRGTSPPASPPALHAAGSPMSAAEELARRLGIRPTRATS